jgi:hypothetical protein
MVLAWLSCTAGWAGQSLFHKVVENMSQNHQSSTHYTVNNNHEVTTLLLVYVILAAMRSLQLVLSILYNLLCVVLYMHNSSFLFNIFYQCGHYTCNEKTSATDSVRGFQVPILRNSNIVLNYAS